jgi:Fur family transcriptional regulator, iron response regulator
MKKAIDRLREYSIQPTPQRVAVAEFVLETDAHPTADEVWATVRRRCPTLSRATVYNTLNLFAEKGLLKLQPLKDGVIVFDAHVEPHHHLIDDETGKVFDVPWNAVKISGAATVDGFEVREYQVVMRGRRRR